MIFKIYSRLVCACVCSQEYITTSLKFPTKAGFKVIKCVSQFTSLCGTRTLSTKGTKQSTLLKTQEFIYYHSLSDTYDMVPLTSNSPCRASVMRPDLFTALLSCSVSIYVCQHTSLPQSRLFLSAPICSLLPNPVCKSTSLQAGADPFKCIMSLTQASFPEK